LSRIYAPSNSQQGKTTRLPTTFLNMTEDRECEKLWTVRERPPAANHLEAFGRELRRMVRRPSRRNFRLPGNQRQHCNLAHRKLTATPRAGAIRPHLFRQRRRMRHCRRRPLRPGTPPVFSGAEAPHRRQNPARSSTVQAANFTFSRGWAIIANLQAKPPENYQTPVLATLSATKIDGSFVPDALADIPNCRTAQCKS